MDPRDVLTRPANPPDAVMAYGSHPEQLVDVHLPPYAVTRDHGRAHPAPVVVLLHGGFWRQRFDRTHTRPMAEALAADGYVVATPEYRRTGGDGGWPMTFDDVVTALAAVRSGLAEVVPGRADLNRVTLVGHSAGGHLAIWAALRTDAPAVDRVVALAPVADLFEGYRRGLDGDAVRALMGGGPDDLPQAYAGADAASLLPVDLPVVVVHGDQDQRVPVEMSRVLAGVDYRELAGVEHFGLIDPRSAAWPAVRAAIAGG